MRRFASTLFTVATLAAIAACSSSTPGPGASPDASSSDGPAPCDASACLASGLTVVHNAQTFYLSTCATVTIDAYNKGTGQSEHCAATIPGCGDASVDTVNGALADPELVALAATGAELLDPTLGPYPDEIVQIGVASPDGGTRPFINVRASCLGAPCPPAAPASVVRLVHAALAIQGLCAGK